MIAKFRNALADIAERVLSTAAQAAIPAVLATGWGTDALAIALGAAGLSLLKCLAALRVGDETAALLPAKDDAGHSDPATLLIVATFVLVLLLAAGVMPR